MKRIIALVCSIVLLLMLAPAVAIAADQRQGTDVTVAAGETITSDLYAFGQTVTVDGKVLGDVVTAGTNVYINGTVTGDVLAAGSEVWITGRVAGSVRALAGTVHVRGTVARDVLVGTGTLIVDAGGKVGGTVLGGTGTLNIGGTVGSIDTQVGTLHLTSSAVVQGPLTYHSDSNMVIDQGAQVHGTTTRLAASGVERFSPIPGAGMGIVDWLRTLMGLFLLGTVGITLAPLFSRRTTEVLTHSPWASLGLGFAVVVCVPIAALAVFVVGFLVGGWWLALVLLALYATLFAVSFVAGGLTLGHLLLRWAGWPHMPMAGELLLGLALLGLVSLVPVAGAILLILVSLLGTGALALASVQTRRLSKDLPLASEHERVQGRPVLETVTRDLPASGGGLPHGVAR